MPADLFTPPPCATDRYGQGLAHAEPLIPWYAPPDLDGDAPLIVADHFSPVYVCTVQGATPAEVEAFANETVWPNQTADGDPPLSYDGEPCACPHNTADRVRIHHKLIL